MQEKYMLDIGRYQVLHKGHEDKFRQAIAYAADHGFKIKKYFVGIGSSQISRTKKNPLDVEERKALLDALMPQFNVPYELVAVPDINNPMGYAAHVEGIIPGVGEESTIIVSGNDYTTKCFSRFDRKYEVFTPKIKEKINATEIRGLIAEGKDYRKLINHDVFKKMKAIHVEEIIREVYSKYEHAGQNQCVDAIILVEDKKEKEDYVVLIQRGRGPFTGFWALPGGRLDKDTKTGEIENEESATYREIEEETRIKPISIQSIRSFRRYESGNDPRGGSSLVYIVRTRFDIEEAREAIKYGDDAADIALFKLDLETLPHLAFQHFDMIKDYLDEERKWRRSR